MSNANLQDPKAWISMTPSRLNKKLNQQGNVLNQEGKINGC
jgi:hypothetical protein